MLVHASWSFRRFSGSRTPGTAGGRAGIPGGTFIRPSAPRPPLPGGRAGRPWPGLAPPGPCARTAEGTGPTTITTNSVQTVFFTIGVSFYAPAVCRSLYLPTAQTLQLPATRDVLCILRVQVAESKGPPSVAVGSPRPASDRRTRPFP